MLAHVDLYISSSGKLLLWVDFVSGKLEPDMFTPKIPSLNHNSTDSLPATDEKCTMTSTSGITQQQQQPLRPDMFNRPSNKFDHHRHIFSADAYHSTQHRYQASSFPNKQETIKSGLQCEGPRFCVPCDCTVTRCCTVNLQENPPPSRSTNPPHSCVASTTHGTIS